MKKKVTLQSWHPWLRSTSVKTSLNIIFIVQILLVVSCEGLVEYSVFDTGVKSEKLNILSCGILSCEGATSHDTVKFVLFSDVHEYYNEMSDAIKSINQQPDLNFVVCMGDISNSGMAKEFQWYADITGRYIYQAFQRSAIMINWQTV